MFAESAEQKASRIGGALLFLLAAYVVASAGCVALIITDPHVSFWARTDLMRCPLFGRYEEQSGRDTDIGFRSPLIRS